MTREAAPLPTPNAQRPTPNESRTAILASIAANVAVGAIKITVAVITHSSAMLAEGVHSLVDSADGGLLWLGQHRAARPPDERHPFGYGRELYFWSFVVALLFFAVGGGFAVYDGVHSIVNPEPLADVHWSYIVLGAALLLDGTSWVIALRTFRRAQHGRGVWETIRTSKDPTQFAVLLEDSADLTGILFAFVSIFLAHQLEMPALDGVGSIAVGLVMMCVAAVLAYQTKALLIGEAASPEVTDALRREASEDPSVLGVQRIWTSQLGPHDVIVILEVAFRPRMSATEIGAAVDRMQKTMRARHPGIRHLYVEPEIPRTQSSGAPNSAL